MISRDRLDATDMDKPLKHGVELLEAELVRAILHGDVATLDRLFSKDALFIDPQGNVLSQAQELDLYASGDLTISTYESGEFILRVFDSTALVNLKVSIGGKFPRQTVYWNLSLHAHLLAEQWAVAHNC